MTDAQQAAADSRSAFERDVAIDAAIAAREARVEPAVGPLSGARSDRPSMPSISAPQGAQPAEPVAKVVSWTNGSYSRNYKLEWLRDVPEGALLYASPADAAPVPQAFVYGVVVKTTASRLSALYGMNREVEVIVNPDSPAAPGGTTVYTLNAGKTIPAKEQTNE